MRELTLSEALLIYRQLPLDLQSPYHHPEFVLLDARYKSNAKAVFFGGKTQDGIFFCPLHFITSPELNIIDAESARGYGGPIVFSADDSFKILSFERFFNWLKSNDTLVEFERLSPLIGNEKSFVGERIFNRLTSAVDLGDYSIKKHGSKSVRYIKKAMKAGCSVTLSLSPSVEQIASFIEVYNNRMSELEASEQYLYPDEYFFELFNTSQKVMLALVHEGDVIIAASSFLLAGRLAEYHLSAATTLGRQLGATNLLLHSVSETLSEESNYDFLHLGGGRTTDIDDPLLQFKQTIGKVSLDFYIGSNVLDRDRYKFLKASQNNSAVFFPNRVIFYRN
ncbi:hypothetical protein [Marinomonas algicola]|uniref:hypothetical protein n=1 Tax=Marinomonas algicola TaxID=2773454 RepID=UPI00174DC526|nr:hypothetical protein [Marinomonas algicola]